MCEFLALHIKTHHLVDIFFIFKTGENELSGEIPSEIGNLVLLENFDAGEIVDMHYFVMSATFFLL